MNNKLHILLVEDSLRDVILIDEALSHSKKIIYDMYKATTLTHACDILKTHTIDIILLDLNLPDSHGLETFTTMSNINPRVPIIVLSELQNEELALSTVHSGAQDYLTKDSIDSGMLTRVILYAIERKSLENKMKGYISIIDQADYAIYSIDLNGIITYWNQASEVMYGYTADEMIGMPVSILLTEELKNINDDVMNSAKENGMISHHQTKRLKKGGEIIDVMLSASAIKNNYNEIIGVSVISKDITKEKLSEQHLAIQYRTVKILNESTDINETAISFLKTISEVLDWKGGEIWIVNQVSMELENIASWFVSDIDAVIQNADEKNDSYLNDSVAKRVWETTLPLWISNIEKDLLYDNKSLLIDSNLKCLFAFPIIFQKKVLGVIVLFNTTIPKPDYHSVSMLMSIGEELGIYLNRKQMELHRYVLEEQLRLKNIELEDQKVFLRQANQAKSIFLANMSHELRAPLNSIIGFSELMYKEKVGPISSQHKDYLGEIVTNSHHILRLINDILDLSKVEAGKILFHVQPTKLEYLINSIHKSMKILLVKKKIEFKSYLHPDLYKEILTDPDRIKQILFNYISNAIKFTPYEGKISVNIFPQNNDFFRIDISDTGIGISENDINKLFEMFGQLNVSYSKPYQGIGLGLALTKHITESLGGYVEVISDVGKGSTFSAILPLVFTSNKDHKGERNGR